MEHRQRTCVLNSEGSSKLLCASDIASNYVCYLETAKNLEAHGFPLCTPFDDVIYVTQTLSDNCFLAPALKFVIWLHLQTPPCRKGCCTQTSQRKNMAYLQSVIYHWLFTREKWMTLLKFTLLRLKWPIWPNVVQPVAKAVQTNNSVCYVHRVCCRALHWSQNLSEVAVVMPLSSHSCLSTVFLCQTAVRDKGDRGDICAYFRRGCLGGGGGSPSWLCSGFLVTCL